MLDDYIGLTPEDWKSLKPQLKNKNEDEQIDTIINHIDPKRKLSAEDFEQAAKPYFDKLENYNLKNNVKQTIKDIVKDNGKTLFYDWILTGLTKKLENKAAKAVHANTNYVREREFVPEIDARDTAMDNVLQHYGNAFANENFVETKNRNLLNQRIPNELDYIGPDYTEPIDINNVPLTPIKPGEVIEPEYVIENVYRDLDGNVVDTQRLRPMDSYLNALRHGKMNFRRDPNTGFMIHQSDLIAAERERRATTGSELVDRLVDVASPRYRHELRTNELLRDITEYEYSMTQSFYSQFLKKHGINPDTGEMNYNPEKVLKRTDVPLSKAFSSNKSGNMAQFIINDKTWNDARQTRNDVERSELVDLFDAIGAEPTSNSEYEITLSPEQKRDILNAARNKYIELTKIDVKEAKGHLAYNVGHHILNILALKPYLRIALKTALAMIKHIPDKSKTGWDKVYNIFLDSGIMPFVAMKKIKQWIQYIPPNIASDIFRWVGSNVNRITRYTGIDYVKRIIEKATSFLPSWSGLNLEYNSNIGTGIEDIGTKFQSGTIAAKLQWNSIKNIIKAIKRHLKANSYNEPEVKIGVKPKVIEQNKSTITQGGMLGLMRMKRNEENSGMRGLMKRQREQENSGMRGLMRRGRQNTS